MRAEILAFGTELLMGETLDTNSAHIAARLPALASTCTPSPSWATRWARWWRCSTVHGALRPDHLHGRAWPTKDDLTREAIAETFGETITFDPDLIAAMERNFRNRGQEMPETNKKQAGVIPPSPCCPIPGARRRLVGGEGRQDHHRDAGRAGRDGF